MAYVARYGHQPASEIGRMTRAQVAHWTKALSRIVAEEMK
jgi:hypothetical protein